MQHGCSQSLLLCFKADKSFHFNQRTSYNRHFSTHSDRDGPLPWFHGKLSHCFGEISVRYWKKTGKDNNKKGEILKKKTYWTTYMSYNLQSKAIQ